MSIKLGTQGFSNIYLGSTKITDAYLGAVRVYSTNAPDPNPLGLPAYTIRAKFPSPPSNNTSSLYYSIYGPLTITAVDTSQGIYDITGSWVYLFGDDSGSGENQRISPRPIEILGANGTGIGNLTYTFAGCSNLVSIPYFDTSSVGSMQYAFRSCTNLASVPLFDTSSVTNMKMCFNSCTSLAQVPLFNTSSVTDMSNAFSFCTSLSYVPLFNTGSVTNMDYVFDGCTALIEIPLFNTSSVTNMNRTFRNCRNVQRGAYNLYVQASSNLSLTFHNDTFANCGINTTTGASELAQIPTSWGGTMA